MSTWEWKDKNTQRMIQLRPHSLTRGRWSHWTSMQKMIINLHRSFQLLTNIWMKIGLGQSHYHGRNEKLWVNMANKHQTRKEGQQHTQTWSLGPKPHKYCKCSSRRVWQYLQHPEPNQTRPPWHIISPCTQYWHSIPNGIRSSRSSRQNKEPCFFGQGTPPWASPSRA